jgi:transcriptional regulator with XRE-family HTH domain
MDSNKKINGKDIVHRIDSVLIQKGIKRQSLADDIGFSVGNITHWKNRGNIPAADIILDIADYLGISYRWIMTGELEDVKSYSPAAKEAAEIVDRLSIDGQKAALAALKGMELSYPSEPQDTVGLIG